MKKYTTLYFDADDTLLDYRFAENQALVSTFKEYNICVTANLLEQYSIVNKQLWLELEKGNINQQFLREERFRLLFEQLDIACDEKKISDSYLEWLSKENFLIDDAEKICASLSRKYTLAIITNGIKKVQISRIRNSAISHYIDYLIISEEAGASKPAKEIFEYAEAKVGEKDRTAILMIGDSLTSDIQGGINFGIDTCWFNPLQKKNDTNLHPNYEINKLVDLNEII